MGNLFNEMRILGGTTMKLKEICKQYNVSKELLFEFKNAGIIEEDWENVEGNIKRIVNKRLETSICLVSLGVDVYTIKKYIFLEESNFDTRKERVKILRRCRDQNLKNVHNTKKIMDCIDCILRDLQSSKE